MSERWNHVIVEPGHIRDVFVNVKGDGCGQGWYRECAGRGSREQGSAIILEGASDRRGGRDIVDVSRGV